MISRYRTFALTAATLVAASLASSAECFAITILDDPFGGSNVACLGRDQADDKTYIMWTKGNVPFHACLGKQQLGDEHGLFDSFEVQGHDGSDYISIGCAIACGFTTTSLQPDFAWGGHYIDLNGGDGNDRLRVGDGNAGEFMDSWLFGGAGADWLVGSAPIGRLLGHDGNDTLESTSSFATGEWLDGGNHDDCLKASGTDIAYFDCGPGNDKWLTFTLVSQNCETFATSCPIPPS
jgi:hypothetical protein